MYYRYMTSKKDIQERLARIEVSMNDTHFWDDKDEAQRTIALYQELKDELAGVGKYDSKDVILTLFAGAGGADAEDFVRILLEMYLGYAEGRGWGAAVIDEHSTDQGGYRNVTVEISGKGAYGMLQVESGVHRLVRISPFNANKKRHTSFAMVEVIPKFEEVQKELIDESDVVFDFSKSSGPGGQNVNKRETAVRATHEPTGISVHVSSERSQEKNRQKALEILSGKLYHRREEERKKKEAGLSISKDIQNEWGSQIRSYVLHPYKLVKDHRTNTEARDVESVLSGDIQVFIDAMKQSNT